MGVLVIGQSPRPEIEREIRLVVGADVEVSVRGALDALSRDEIDALGPERDADALFTHLPDGSDVEISKQGVIRHGELQLKALLDEGFDVVMVNCSGEFADWSRKYRVVFPSLVLDGLVRALSAGKKLGIFVPIEAQVEPLGERWRCFDAHAAVVAMRPTAADDELRECARTMAAQKPELLVYDCMSYTLRTKAIVEAVVGCPGLLAISSAARAAQELMSTRGSGAKLS
jgi:protein AroM